MKTFLFIVICFLSLPIQAQTLKEYVRTLVPNGAVTDYGEIYSEKGEKLLTHKIEQFKELTGTTYRICTVKELPEHLTTPDVAYTYNNYWNKDEAIKNNSVLFFVNKSEQMAFIITGSDIDSHISQEKMQKIFTDEIIPPFKEDNFFTGTINAIEQINNTIENTPLSTTYLDKSKRYTNITIFICFTLALLGAYLLFKRRN